MIQSVPDQVDADADMALKARLSCPDGCDLRGSMVRIVGQDAAVVKEIELIGFDGTVNETDELGLAKLVGECSLSGGKNRLKPRLQLVLATPR